MKINSINIKYTYNTHQSPILARLKFLDKFKNTHSLHSFLHKFFICYKEKHSKHLQQFYFMSIFFTSFRFFGRKLNKFTEK